MIYGSVREFATGIKNDLKSGKRLVPIIEIVIVVFVVFAFILGVLNGVKSLLSKATTSTATSTEYAPQILNDSPNSVQVQGNGNTVFAEKPEPTPITKYTIALPNQLYPEDGLYHAVVDVEIKYAKRGRLKISSELVCSDRYEGGKTLQVPDENGQLYVGYLWRYDCGSKKLIVENADYFQWINDE